MSVREVVAVAVLVWLVGAVLGWCVGWAARGEQNRGWYGGVARELARTRSQLAHADAELEAYAQGERFPRLAPPAPPPVVVQVHLPPLVMPSWVAGQAVTVPGEVVVLPPD